MAEVDRLDHVVCILTSCKGRRYKDERRIREKTRGRQESSFEVSMKRERGQKKRGGGGRVAGKRQGRGKTKRKLEGSCWKDESALRTWKI